MKIQRVLLTSASTALLAANVFSAPQLPHRFSNGDVADADQFNENFESLDGRVSDIRNQLDTDVPGLADQISGLNGQSTELANQIAELRLLFEAQALELAEQKIQAQAQLEEQSELFDETNALLQEALAAETLKVASLEARMQGLELVLTVGNLTLLDEILPRMSVVQLDQLDGTTAETIRFRGVNVQITNGLSKSDSKDGTGNLILGHAETNSTFGGDIIAKQLLRTGSHNIILGRGNAYSGFGGLVIGQGNHIAGEASSVLGGALNSSLGNHTVIVAGQKNEVASDGFFNAIVGGRGNKIESPQGGAAAQDSTLLGGIGKTVVGSSKSVL